MSEEVSEESLIEFFFWRNSVLISGFSLEKNKGISVVIHARCLERILRRIYKKKEILKKPLKKISECIHARLFLKIREGIFGQILEPIF